MKKLFILLLIFLTLAGCNDQTEALDPDLIPQLETEIKPNVEVLPENTSVLSSIEQLNDGILIIEPASALENIASGDIIIGQDGEGYLVRVISIVTEGNQAVLEVQQATMEDVFENAEFSIVSDITQGRGAVSSQVQYMAEGVSMMEDGFTFNFSNTVIYQDGPLVFKIENGTAAFNPNFEIDFDFEDGTLQEFNFEAENANLVIDCDVFLGLSASGNVVNASTTLAEYDKTFTTFVGFVPVIVVVSTELVAELSVDASAQIGFTSGFTNTNTVTLGASYNAGVWTGINDTNSSITGKPLDNTAEAELSQNLTITPKVSVKFYSVVGPYCQPQMTEDFNFAINTQDLDWNADLKAGLNIIVGADAEVLGATLVDFNTSVFATETTVWNGPDALVRISDSNQTGTQGAQLTEPLKVRVLDSFDNPMSNIPVYFDVAPNDGSVDNTSIMTDDDGYAEALWTLGTLNTEQSVSVEVRNANGSVISGAPIQFTATAEPAELALLGNMDFGDVEIGTSEDRILTIENESDITANISSIDVPNGFTVNWQNGPISAQSQQEVTVTFSPTEVQDYNGQLVVNNDIDDLYNVRELTGSGVVLDALVLSGDLNFGEVTINNTSTRELTIQNNASVNMSVSALNLPSGYSADWTSGNINAMNSQTVTITFSPIDLSNYDGIISVENDLDSENNQINVFGVGVEGASGIDGIWTTSYINNNCIGSGTPSSFYNNRELIFEPNDDSSGSVNVDSFLNQTFNESYTATTYNFDGTTLLINIQTAYITSGGDSITRGFTFDGVYDTNTDTFTGDFTYDWNNASDGSFDKDCQGTLTLSR